MLCLFRAELGVPGVEELAFLVVGWRGFGTVGALFRGFGVLLSRLGSVAVLVGAGLVRLEQK